MKPFFYVNSFFLSFANVYVPNTYFFVQADILVDVECDPNRIEQLKRMLKREVQDFEVVPPQSGEEFPPPTPLSAAASFGKLYIIMLNVMIEEGCFNLYSDFPLIFFM